MEVVLTAATNVVAFTQTMVRNGRLSDFTVATLEMIEINCSFRI